MRSHNPIQHTISNQFTWSLLRKLYQRRVLFFIGIWSAYFSWFWHKALTFNEYGDLVAGHVNIWGDWAVHLTMTTAIAERGLNITSPILVHAPFTYPFFINAVSALLIRLHIDLISAMIIPSLLFSIALVLTLLWSFKQFFKSWNISMLATTFFLLSGGLGFLYAGKTLLTSNNPVYELLNPSQRYTRIDQVGIKWINVIDSMIIPQRAFSPGFSIAVIALTLIYQWWTKHKKNTWRVILAALLIGILPIIQTHAFLAVFIILCVWAVSAISVDVLFAKAKDHKTKFDLLLKTAKSAVPWIAIAAIVSIFAIPLLVQIGALRFNSSSSAITTHSFSFLIGWLANEYKQPWWFFALQNWGLVPIVALFGLFIHSFQFKSKSDRAKQFLAFVSFFVLFILANIILFQPFSWDNTKIFIWAHFGFSGLAAYTIAHWHSKTKKLPNTAKKRIGIFLLCGLVLTLTASGALDAYRILRHQLDSYVFLSKDELALADWSKQNTDPHSIWLTGDQHNHWLFTMTGRQPVMAYRGWLWTHGYNYRPQESAVSKLYTQPQNNLSLIKQYDIEYVVIGPHEKNVWKANEQAWSDLFPVVHQSSTTRIFRTTNPLYKN
jgi:hypothetical protein